MCLYVTKKRADAKTRTVAWKVVQQKSRKPLNYHLPRGRAYTVGSKHRTRKKLRKERNTWGEHVVNFGFHVYTTLARAQEAKDGRAYKKIIKVQVSPRDWFADGTGDEAVYRALKVLT